MVVESDRHEKVAEQGRTRICIHESCKCSCHSKSVSALHDRAYRDRPGCPLRPIGLRWVKDRGILRMTTRYHILISFKI
jgi:hypothetical protein